MLEGQSRYYKNVSESMAGHKENNFCFPIGCKAKDSGFTIEGFYLFEYSVAKNIKSKRPIQGLSMYGFKDHTMTFL